jgi:hypothetical protein
VRLALKFGDCLRSGSWRKGGLGALRRTEVSGKHGLGGYGNAGTAAQDETMAPTRICRWYDDGRWGGVQGGYRSHRTQANTPGGKGTPRRKQVKKSVTSTQGDDRKLQAALKKLSVQPITGVEEVNMFKEDGNVLHFQAPKGES